MNKKRGKKMFKFIDTINGDSFSSTIPANRRKSKDVVVWPGRSGVIYKRKKGTSNFYARKVSKKK